MNNFFEKKNVEKLWWYGLNIITTLFIVSFVSVNAPQGPAGSPGSNGVNGVDGQDGEDGAAAGNLYPVSAIQYEAAPAGAAREAYAQARVAEGYIPISSLEDLAIFTTNPDGSIDDGYYGNDTSYDSKYVLTADLDFFGEDINENYPYMIPGYFSTPDDGDSVYFTGIFDGAGYSIKNFELYRVGWNYAVGFFPYTADAIIRNVSFENHKIVGEEFSGEAGGVVGFVDGPTLLQNIQINNATIVSDNNSGGLVGTLNDRLTVLNVHTNLGHVHGNSNSGGFVGRLDNDYRVYIQDSSNRLTVDDEAEELLDYSLVSPSDDSGGFIGSVGYADEVIFLNSFNAGFIRSDGDTAGFIGYVEYARILVFANSYNTGTIIASDGAEAAGFIADVESPFPIYIQNSFNAGTVVANNTAAGLIAELSHYDGNDSYDYYPLYITNSYNAGFIASYGLNDERGGLVGEVRDDRHVIIQNSFNVGQFSPTISQSDLESHFKDNGALIGDASGTYTLDNVAYYYDLENPDLYLPNAVDAEIDRGPLQINDLAAFTEDDFMFEATWDFETIWSFQPTGYAFPVLRELTFVESNYEPENQAPEIDGLYYDYNVQFNDEAGMNEIYFFEFYLTVVDLESYGENLQTVIYAVLDFSAESVDELPESTQTVVAFEGYEFSASVYDGNALSFIPNQGDGNYSFYVYVEDETGLSAFEILGEIEYESGVVPEDLEAPVPGNGGALSAEFTFFPDEITFTFVEAMDNLTTQENLGYVAIVAQSGFDFMTWDFNPEISAILGYNEFTNLNIAAGSYVFEDDLFEADFNTRYEVALIVFDEAGNHAYYQTTFVEYID